jgi:hypothetical protein
MNNNQDWERRFWTLFRKRKDGFNGIQKLGHFTKALSEVAEFHHSHTGCSTVNCLIGFKLSQWLTLADGLVIGRTASRPF